MDYERHIVRMALTELAEDEVAPRFQKHTGIDLKDIPAKYGDSVLKAKAFIDEKLSLAIVWQCFDIAAKEADAVTLVGGQRFSGEMPGRILRHAEQVVCFVATLPGFNEIRDAMGDMMEDYFLDTWGTVYAECALFWMENYLHRSLSGSGQRSAFSWNPGQHKFELLNQKPLFELLHPEEIGCTLDRHMRMIPFKSASGIVPIVPESVPPAEDLVPCELCPLGKTCPASKARLQSMGR